MFNISLFEEQQPKRDYKDYKKNIIEIYDSYRLWKANKELLYQIIINWYWNFIINKCQNWKARVQLDYDDSDLLQYVYLYLDECLTNADWSLKYPQINNWSKSRLYSRLRSLSRYRYWWDIPSPEKNNTIDTGAEWFWIWIISKKTDIDSDINNIASLHSSREDVISSLIHRDDYSLYDIKYILPQYSEYIDYIIEYKPSRFVFQQYFWISRVKTDEIFNTIKKFYEKDNYWAS